MTRFKRNKKAGDKPGLFCARRLGYRCLLWGFSIAQPFINRTIQCVHQELVAILITITEVFVSINHMPHPMFINIISNVRTASIAYGTANQSTICVRINNNFVVLIRFS